MPEEGTVSEWSTAIKEVDEVEEEEDVPLWVMNLKERWHSIKQKMSNAWKRRGAVKQFLRAVKEVC